MSKIMSPKREKELRPIANKIVRVLSREKLTINEATEVLSLAREDVYEILQTILVNDPLK